MWTASTVLYFVHQKWRVGASIALLARICHSLVLCLCNRIVGTHSLLRQHCKVLLGIEGIETRTLKRRAPQGRQVDVVLLGCEDGLAAI